MCTVWLHTYESHHESADIKEYLLVSVTKY